MKNASNKAPALKAAVKNAIMARDMSLNGNVVILSPLSISHQSYAPNELQAMKSKAYDDSMSKIFGSVRP